MIAVIRSLGEVVISPFEVRHTDSELSELSILLKNLDDETHVVIEATGNYHALIAYLLNNSGFDVSVVNAIRSRHPREKTPQVNSHNINLHATRILFHTIIKNDASIKSTSNTITFKA